MQTSWGATLGNRGVCSRVDDRFGVEVDGTICLALEVEMGFFPSLTTSFFEGRLLV